MGDRADRELGGLGGLRASRGFGPSALVTPANAVTAGRVIVLPFLVWAMVARADRFALVLWIAVGLSDSLDGVLARRQGATRSGAYLDPLADKAVVLTALAVLAGQHRAPWVAVLVIGVREMAVSLWRSVLARRGASVPASRAGKLKTLLQVLAVGFVLLHVRAAGAFFLWTAVVVALGSAVDYFLRSRRTTVTS